MAATYVPQVGDLWRGEDDAGRPVAMVVTAVTPPDPTIVGDEYHVALDHGRPNRISWWWGQGWDPLECPDTGEQYRLAETPSSHVILLFADAWIMTTQPWVHSVYTSLDRAEKALEKLQRSDSAKHQCYWLSRSFKLNSDSEDV